LSNTLHC